MNAPEGFTVLDFVGFTDKGDYEGSGTYTKNDLVHYQNNIWKCLIDGTFGIEPVECSNWTIFIRSAADLVGLNVTDTEGIAERGRGSTVDAQTLMDAISNIVGRFSITDGKICLNYEE